MVRGPLGCASGYTARFTYRANGRTFGEATIPDITELAWSRTLNDTADASITVSKKNVGAACCRTLDRLQPYVHELSIMRDGVLVWQGPVVRKTENRATYLVEAHDVVGYLDRAYNTGVLTYTSTTPDDEGRMRGQVTWIAWHIIRWNMVLSSLSVPDDYARIMDYIVRRDTSKVIKYEKDGDNNKRAAWTQYVGQILRALTKRGLTFTTVGRSLYLKAGAAGTDRAVARLTLDDFLGDVQVITDGASLATRVVATTQNDQDLSDGKSVGTGKVGTPYGRAELIVRVDEEDPSEADLLEAAQLALNGRYPCPVVVTVPDGSQLAPSAPCEINDLVPGERFDVSTSGFCTEMLQAFRLSDVQVSWTPAGEKINITLVPLNQLTEGTMYPAVRGPVPSFKPEEAA